MSFIQDYSYKDWILEGQGAELPVINPTGQWGEYTPIMESQVRGWDFYGCTNFSTLNCIEILHKYQTGIEVNYSDRYSIITSGTSPTEGNSLRAVADSISHEDWGKGLVLESDLPVVDDKVEFYKMPDGMIEKGKKWLEKYHLNYWIVRPRHGTYHEDIKDALTRSPLAVLVAYDNGDGVINPKGFQNHLVALVGYREGEYWEIMDSYQKKIKKYAWDYFFGALYAYRLTIKKDNMLIVKENECYHLVEGQEQKLALGINGSLFIADKGDELWVQMMSVKRKKIKFSEFSWIDVGIADWNSVDHYNLKGELLRLKDKQ